MAEFGFHKICNELRQLLNQPLPGGRGFQQARYKRIHLLAKTLSEQDIPTPDDSFLRQQQEKAMGPRPEGSYSQPIFRDHNCGGCDNGARPCREGNYASCSWPRARND